MGGERTEHERNAQLRMRGKEVDQAELFESRRFHARAPARTLRRRLGGKPLLPLFKQCDRIRRRQVEGTPVVRRQHHIGNTGRAQGDRKRFECQCEAQRLVVGQRATRGEVTEGAGWLCRVMWIAEHARQLQAHLYFHVHGDRRCILADVVRVVRQREHVRRQSRQQQVGCHVTDVARTMERHRFFQRSGQQM